MFPSPTGSRVLVPCALFPKAWATVNWDSGSGKIEVELDGKKLGLTLGSTRVMVDGVPKELDVPPSLVKWTNPAASALVGENLGP